jgi:hypothetical protein
MVKSLPRNIFSTTELLEGLASASVFLRGLPLHEDLQKLPIRRVLDAVCHLNVTTMTSWRDDNEDREALTECFRKGWLHADVLSVHQVDEHVGYVFASPLHRWYIGRKLRDEHHASPRNW